MLHKVEEAVMMASDFGIETQIFSGKIGGKLKRTLEGEAIINSTKILSDTLIHIAPEGKVI
jgi:hypothetical protein